MKHITINSWEDLQKNVNTITRQLNKDQNLLLAAASNPLMALEELGYNLNPDILAHIEDKMRFKTRQVAQLKRLRKDIHKKAGKVFNIRSQTALNTLLFKDLELTVYDTKARAIQKDIKLPEKEEQDELIKYEGLHPVIAPLLEFRNIDNTTTGFCDKITYQKIRNGELKKVKNIQLKIQLKKSKK